MADMTLCGGPMEKTFKSAAGYVVLPCVKLFLFGKLLLKNGAFKQDGDDT